MTKIFVAAVACVAIAAALAAAMPRDIKAAAASTVTAWECTDPYCKSGCKAVGHETQNQCTVDKFHHAGSSKVNCTAPKTASMCVYVALFAENATGGATCAESTDHMLDFQQCDVCEADPHTGEHRLIGGCHGTTGVLSVKLGCDAKCATCKHTYQVKEKQCIVPPKPFKFAVGYSAPQPCGSAIAYTHWKNPTCAGAPEASHNVFANACYRFMGHSRYYQCA